MKEILINRLTATVDANDKNREIKLQAVNTIGLSGSMRRACLKYPWASIKAFCATDINPASTSEATVPVDEPLFLKSAALLNAF